MVKFIISTSSHFPLQNGTPLSPFMFLHFRNFWTKASVVYSQSCGCTQVVQLPVARFFALKRELKIPHKVYSKFLVLKMQNICVKNWCKNKKYLI